MTKCKEIFTVDGYNQNKGKEEARKYREAVKGFREKFKIEFEEFKKGERDVFLLQYYWNKKYISYEEMISIVKKYTDCTDGFYWYYDKDRWVEKIHVTTESNWFYELFYKRIN